MAAIYIKGEAEYKAGAQFNGGGQTDYQGRGSVRRGARAGSGDRRSYAGSTSCTRPRTAGLMTTGGGLVFGSNSSSFFALDAQKGALLWRFETGGGIDANPISYMSGGKQYVAIAAGHALLVFSLE